MTVTAGSWSSGACNKAINFLTYYTTSEENLFVQSATIRREYCFVNWEYESVERENCMNFVTDFWEAIAKVSELQWRSSKIRCYWIHDFVATFGVNDRPIYIVLCN